MAASLGRLGMNMGVLLAHETWTDLQLVPGRACDFFCPLGAPQSQSSVGNHAFSFIAPAGLEPLYQGSQIQGPHNLPSLPPLLRPSPVPGLRRHWLIGLSQELATPLCWMEEGSEAQRGSVIG